MAFESGGREFEEAAFAAFAFEVGFGPEAAVGL